MPLDFEKQCAKGNLFVRMVADLLDVPLVRSRRVIYSVLHAIRNILDHEQSFRVLEQLPLPLKGVYVEGWDFHADYAAVHHINDFFGEVLKADGDLAIYDFRNYEQERIAVASVFSVLHQFIADAGMQQLLRVLPLEIREFVEESTV